MTQKAPVIKDKISIDDDITIFYPVEEEQNRTQVLASDIALTDDDESLHGEGKILRLAEEATKSPKKKRDQPPKKASESK